MGEKYTALWLIFLAALLSAVAVWFYKDVAETALFLALFVALFVFTGNVVVNMAKYKENNRRPLKVTIFLGFWLLVIAGIPICLFGDSVINCLFMLFFLGGYTIYMVYQLKGVHYSVISEVITLHRFGRLMTENTAYNQCKDKGHHLYDYKVSMVCQNKLYPNGWLIDHREINKAMCEALTYINSCEAMCIHFADVVEQLIKDHGIIMHELHVYLEPVPEVEGPKNFAGFELIRKYNIV